MICIVIVKRLLVLQFQQAIIVGRQHDLVVSIIIMQFGITENWITQYFVWFFHLIL